jgi:hypothetical protein
MSCSARVLATLLVGAAGSGLLLLALRLAAAALR